MTTCTNQIPPTALSLTFKGGSIETAKNRLTFESLVANVHIIFLRMRITLFYRTGRTQLVQHAAKIMVCSLRSETGLSSSVCVVERATQ